MRFGIVVFPGSNCDHDCYHVVKHVLNQEAEFVWHKDRVLTSYDAIIIPGGFSYGDYLRTGAVAKFSPVMHAVKKFAKNGGLVIGICNGFQILLEAGLLPGAMLRNSSLKFICRNTYISVENMSTPFTSRCSKKILKLPIAHAEGNYFADQATLKRLNENQQIIFRYCNESGEITESENPNGSMENIAGICNEAGNVLGMMPHPERCSEPILGNEDGKSIFESIIDSSVARWKP